MKAGAAVTIAAAVGNAAGPTTVEIRSCSGSNCQWNAASSLGTDASAPYQVGWKAPKSGTITFLAQVTDADESDLSDPVSVTIKKKKKKKH